MSGTLIAKPIKERPNILIISICSLNKSIFYKNIHLFPNLKKIYNSSDVYNNAYSHVSWTNLSKSMTNITESFLMDNKYRTFGAYYEIKRINQIKRLHSYYKFIPQFTSDGYLNNHLQESVKEISNFILSESSKSFFSFLHFKFLHLPYFNYGGSYSLPLYYPQIIKGAGAVLLNSSIISFSNKKYLSKIIKKKSFDKSDVILQLLLFGKVYNKDASLFISKNKISGVMALINNKNYVRAWKKTSHFKRDLILLKEVYLERIYQFDLSLGKILESVEYSSLLKKTLIILTGDHGESFYKHGQFIHGTTTYDEVIGFPLLIKKPTQKKMKLINRQVSHDSVANFIQRTMQYGVNIASKLTENNFIFSHNCNKDIFSVRNKNKYKLIYNVVSNNYELYDLSLDPLELKNLSNNSKSSSVFMNLNLKLWEYIINLKKLDDPHYCRN